MFSDLEVQCVSTAVLHVSITAKIIVGERVTLCIASPVGDRELPGAIALRRMIQKCYTG